GSRTNSFIDLRNLSVKGVSCQSHARTLPSTGGPATVDLTSIVKTWGESKQIEFSGQGEPHPCCMWTEKSYIALPRTTDSAPYTYAPHIRPPRNTTAPRMLGPNTCAQRPKKLATSLRMQTWCELRRVRCSAWLGRTSTRSWSDLSLAHPQERRIEPNFFDGIAVDQESIARWQ